MNILFSLYLFQFIIHIMLIIYIFCYYSNYIHYSVIALFLGSYRPWNCRSRMAGQTRRDCPNCRSFGRSVSSSHARWLAEIHPDSLCCTACIRCILHWTGHFDRGWRRVMMCCFSCCQRGWFLQWILTRIAVSTFDIMSIIAKIIRIIVE